MKKIIHLLAIGLALAGLAVLINNFAMTQGAGTKRTELQQHDLSIQGREVIQATIEIEPGVEFGDHRHPGEEFIYVLEGEFEYIVGGKQMIVKAGEVLFIPAGTVHSAKNTSSVKATELATYVVEKGKPLIEMVK